MELRSRPSRSRPSEPDQGPGERSPGPFAAVPGRADLHRTHLSPYWRRARERRVLIERIGPAPIGVKRALWGAASVAAGSAVASRARLWPPGFASSLGPTRRLTPTGLPGPFAHSGARTGLAPLRSRPRRSGGRHDRSHHRQRWNAIDPDYKTGSPIEGTAGILRLTTDRGTVLVPAEIVDRQRLFAFGPLVATPGALRALVVKGQTPLAYSPITAQATGAP